MKILIFPLPSHVASYDVMVMGEKEKLETLFFFFLILIILKIGMRDLISVETLISTKSKINK